MEILTTRPPRASNVGFGQHFIQITAGSRRLVAACRQRSGQTGSNSRLYLTYIHTKPRHADEAYDRSYD